VSRASCSATSAWRSYTLPSVAGRFTVARARQIFAPEIEGILALGKKAASRFDSLLRIPGAARWLWFVVKTGRTILGHAAHFIKRRAHWYACNAAEDRQACQALSD